VTFIKVLPYQARIPMKLGRLAFLKGLDSPRKLISLESERSLSYFCSIRPNLGRGLLNVIDRLGPKVKQVIFHAALAEPQNREIVIKFIRDHQFAKSLVDEKGVLDFRRASLKLKRPYIDLTSNSQPKTLEDYREILDKSSHQFRKDPELGNLFLYKSLLRARIDLYIAGEKRSARKAKGKDIGFTTELARVKDFFDCLLKNFPFGSINERGYLKEKIEVTSLLLGRKNNTAAYATLVPTTDRLGIVLSQQISARLAQVRNSRDWKVKPLRGRWIITQSGYRATETGMLRREVVKNKVSTEKLLSMIQHEIDSVAKESSKNIQFLAELEFIKRHLPDNWDGLYEIYLTFTKYFDHHKEKACVEIEGALRLLAVGSTQSINLADGMIWLAQRDIEARQDALDAQTERLTCIKGQIERKLGDYLRRSAVSISQDLASSDILFGEEAVDKIDNRLGGLLGTFFEGEMREDWLKKAKSRVVGLKMALPKLEALLELKRTKMALIKSGTTDNPSAVFSEISRLNEEIIDKLEKGAEYILEMELIFINRRERQICEDEFYRGHGILLRNIRTLNAFDMPVITRRGKSLGRVLESEAQMMGMKIEKRGRRKFAVLDLT
jgi:hypothetical protein